MNVRAIKPKDYELILEQDRRVYPTNEPVNKETLASWYKKNPEFGMIFEEDGRVIGNCIVIPLNKKGWLDLTNKNIPESQIGENIFDSDIDSEIGIHIYHIEKFSDVKGFYKLALQELSKILNNLKKQNQKLKIIGASALSVTNAGIGLFENKFGFNEKILEEKEYVLERDGKKIVSSSILPGYNLIARCKMLVLYPEDKSVFWDYLDEDNFKNTILKESEEIDGITIKGWDFNNGVNWNKLIDSFSSTGFQASHMMKAVEIIKEMRETRAFIYLGYTSNMISSGVREIIRYLAEHKLVDLIVTTAGGIEEDFIKCLGDFKLGDFRANGKELREKGINRIGNIFVPNSRYVKFENWILPILEEIKNKETNLTPSKLIKILGERINNKDSVYYWTSKNNIPVFCPAVMDGSLGDMIYFFKNKHPDFKLDITDDTCELNNSSLGKHKTGMIILGGGVVKHSICNANLYRNGADYAVYINSNPEFVGSDSGALPEEAKSWGKIQGEGKAIKVFGDATILFPIIVGKAFAQ